MSKRSISQVLDAPPAWLGRPRQVCQRLFFDALQSGAAEVAIPRFLVLEGYGPEGHGRLANDAEGWRFSHEGVGETGHGEMCRAFVFVREEAASCPPRRASGERC